MEFLLIASAHFLALLSPGPDFFLILQAALRSPLRYGLSLCAGIAVANAVYILMAIVGLELLGEVAWLVKVLKYIGGLYLIWLGVMLLRTRRNEYSEQVQVPGEAAKHPGRHFLMGFMSALLNPKNGLFYLSIFTVLVSEHTSPITRWFYGGWMVSVVLLWDSLLVVIIGSRWVRNMMGGSVFWMEKLAGLMLVGCGGVLGLQ